MKYTEEQIIQIKLDYPDMNEDSIKNMIHSFLTKVLPEPTYFTFFDFYGEPINLWQIVGAYGIIGDLIKIDDDTRVECHKSDEMGSRITLYRVEDILAYLKEFKITPTNGIFTKNIPEMKHQLHGDVTGTGDLFLMPNAPVTIEEAIKLLKIPKNVIERKDWHKGLSKLTFLESNSNKRLYTLDAIRELFKTILYTMHCCSQSNICPN